MTLKEMRINAGHTQKAVAESIPNATQSLVSQWESGMCCPHTTVISKLARLYGVTADDVIAAVAAARKQTDKGTDHV